MANGEAVFMPGRPEPTKSPIQPTLEAFVAPTMPGYSTSSLLEWETLVQLFATILASPTLGNAQPVGRYLMYDIARSAQRLSRSVVWGSLSGSDASHYGCSLDRASSLSSVASMRLKRSSIAIWFAIDRSSFLPLRSSTERIRVS